MRLRSSSTWATLTLSLLGSSLRTLSFPSRKRLFKASRRVRTTLIQHVTLEMRGVPTVLTHYTAWDSPHFMLNMQCQGGDASRSTMFYSLRPKQTPSIALPVRVGAASATWARNKYTATIKIQSSSVVLLSACVKLGNQTRTTKSLTGGTPNTLQLRFQARSYIASLKRGLYAS